eukprot:1378869-Rhodomonas_salina.1
MEAQCERKRLTQPCTALQQKAIERWRVQIAAAGPLAHPHTSHPFHSTLSLTSAALAHPRPCKASASYLRSVPGTPRRAAWRG